VLVFPTAGGDAEEIERFQMIRALEPLLAAGRIKIYSPDSVAGRVWFNREGTPEHRMAMQHQYHEWIRHEVVPAIYMDCKTDGHPHLDRGRFHRGLPRRRGGVPVARRVSQVAVDERHVQPDALHRGDTPTELFKRVSPLYMVPRLEGKHLELLRTRFLEIATGEGRWENLGESYGLANVLGAKGIPNHVDSWGPDWHHDWVTWREHAPASTSTVDEIDSDAP
jgi:esterase/lipase superfamily enzyme